MPAESFDHVHLDPVGGIAGDMAVAALLDLAPELEPVLLADLRRAGVPADIEILVEGGQSGGMRGRRFIVRSDVPAVPGGHYTDLDALIAAAPLSQRVRDRARSIMRRIAVAEAEIHGAPLDHIHFHELAGWDSLVDVLAAAWLIERWPAACWSVASLPVGGGRIRSAHGLLPVPAPATALLLQGFLMHDDGITGERVTPTGAAILADLGPSSGPGPVPLRLAATGHGLGTRMLPGLPNMLRATGYTAADSAATSDQVAVLRFEIDDQTPEDLALGLDRLRVVPGVLDVVQWPVTGKRGRLGVTVQVLARPERAQAAVDACLTETSTLGVRTQIQQRRVLERELVQVGDLQVKRARRPDGSVTAKAELVDLARIEGGAGARSNGRRAAEARAIGEDK